MKKILVGIGSLIILGGLAFGGWWQFVREEAKPAPTPSTNNTQNTTPSDPSEGGKYLVIKEWGVKFELTDEIRDASYVMTSNAAIGLTTERIKKIDACAKFPILGVARGTLDDPITNAGTPRELIARGADAAITKVGDYYFATNGPGFSCVKTGKAEDEALLASVKRALNDQLRTMSQL